MFASPSGEAIDGLEMDNQEKGGLRVALTAFVKFTPGDEQKD